MRAVVVLFLIMIPVRVRILAASPPPGTEGVIGPRRSAIMARLESLPEPQIVLVRYGAEHKPLSEWVYNGADVDHAKVIWARDMGPAQNEELLRYYKDRQVWLLDADENPPELNRYPARSQLSSAAVPESRIRGLVEAVTR